jgi:hypothetical protein
MSRPSSPSREVSRLFKKLYEDEDGYDIDREEERAIRRSMGDPLYGELLPAGCEALLKRLDMGPRDVFYDLGSGVGKVVIHTAMRVPLKRCVGVELSPTRSKLARSALARARKSGLIVARRTTFRCENLLESKLDDATVIYSCSTAFSDRFMRKLVAHLRDRPSPVRFVSLRYLDNVRGVKALGEFGLKTNWNPRADTYLYEITPR